MTHYLITLQAVRPCPRIGLFGTGCSTITRYLETREEGPVLLSLRSSAADWCAANPHDFVGFEPWRVVCVQSFPSAAEARFFLQQVRPEEYSV